MPNPCVDPRARRVLETQIDRCVPRHRPSTADLGRVYEFGEEVAAMPRQYVQDLKDFHRHIVHTDVGQ